MPNEPVRVAPNSEIARLIDKMDGTTILLEKDGDLYRLSKEIDIWVDYDPQRTRLALQQSAGALSDLDREEFLNDIHLGRQQDSKGRPT